MPIPRITLEEGDITRVAADAIVNAANSSLLGGGGVDGAIHRAGGPRILEECRRLRASQYGKGLPTGQAVATTAGNLSASWVIHTVGPVYSATQDRAGLLADCHRNTLRVADELGARSVAFPAISTGIPRRQIPDPRGRQAQRPPMLPIGGRWTLYLPEGGSPGGSRRYGMGGVSRALGPRVPADSRFTRPDSRAFRFRLRAPDPEPERANRAGQAS
ncbi:MAG TPA: O-acetyl-ADP-ribose deacetylase [Actinospica sp.]|nr:O-acetyl-ADP-ribose deacetylase [Actinospica sp.]